jgi:hypothetical protein
MDLIELPKSQLQLGMTLKFTIRDENGEALLVKGQRIMSFRQLETEVDPGVRTDLKVV